MAVRMAHGVVLRDREIKEVEKGVREVWLMKAEYLMAQVLVLH